LNCSTFDIIYILLNGGMIKDYGYIWLCLPSYKHHT